MNPAPAYAYVTLAILPGVGKIYLDGIFGNNFPEIPIQDRESFDPTFGGDDRLKHRLLSKWPNLSPPPPQPNENENATVTSSTVEDPTHHLKLKFEKHAHLLNMHQKEYFETSLKLFERVEQEIQYTFVSCCYGFVGSRPLFQGEYFITKLKSSYKLWPTIHTVRKEVHGEQPRQILTGIRLYMDGNFHFILPPLYEPWAVQGDYIPNEHVFLL